MTLRSVVSDLWRARTRSGRKVALCVAAALLAASLFAAPARAGGPTPPSADQHYQSARAAFLAGNLTTADLEVRLAIQGNPANAASHFLLGCVLERKGQNDQAVVGFQQALALDPTNPAVLYNLGTMLLRRGEAAPASSLLENAVSLRPDYVPTYNNLGKAYFLAGLPELAVAAYEEALRRDPSNVIALKNLRLLAEAAGHEQAAAAYRSRLDAIASGQSGSPVVTADSLAAPMPVWPVAPRTAGSLSSMPLSDVAALQPPPDEEADALRDLLRDLTHVKVERRGGQLALLGWTQSPQEKETLLRILAGWKNVLDLTTADVGDPERMLEIDAIIFVQYKIDQVTTGFNFLDLIKMNLSYFAADNRREGTGYSAPGTIGAVTGAFQSGWVFSASMDYLVNIANAANQHVAVLARPHLTTLSGTPATFLSGGEIVFKVSGINSGDIKPYPFGTTLKVTPTLLRSVGEDGSPRVNILVEAGRTSVLDLLGVKAASDQVTFDKLLVTSQTVVGLGQTLILSGLNQREARTGRSGVPGLMYVPGLKYLFSTKTTVTTDSAVIVLLTPRDPAYMDARNRATLSEFVEKRRAYMRARQGTEEDMRRYKERYPDWADIAPNRFASHFFLVNNSELYRSVSGQDVVSDALDLELIGPPPAKKKTK
jgi:Tfp pilus assembly protein PilF